MIWPSVGRGWSGRGAEDGTRRRGPTRVGPFTSGRADFKIKANSWILVATAANTGHASIREN